MIRFELGGKPVDPQDIGDALLKAAVTTVVEDVRGRIGVIRHPETGEFPTIVVAGSSIDDISFRIEGSPELLSMVRERMDMEKFDKGASNKTGKLEAPRAFLSYNSQDRDLAEKIARRLQESGVETWWDRWSIGSGESLRQKIDEGIGGCTHFIVLLTPRSIDKPWVNQEMDAGLVRKIRDQCRFIVLRHELAAKVLPPLLSGMLSPEITGADADLRDLVNDIYGISRKPPLGPAPAITSLLRTGYSSAATAVAMVFVERTEDALFGDPQLSTAEIAAQTKLSEDDVTDALHELGELVQGSFDHVLPEPTLFAAFDKYFQSWDPSDDALRLAADLVNDSSFPGITSEIGERYGWLPRRLNPAIAYLTARAVILSSETIGTHPWITHWIQKNDATRRFAKSRS